MRKRRLKQSVKRKGTNARYRVSRWFGADRARFYSDAIAFRDGVVAALGQDARALAEDPNGEVVDLEGGTLIPAFGDGHAHPLLAGLEAEGPQVRGLQPE